MDPSFICDTCGKTFKTKQSMKQHIRNCHEADKECEECNKNFTGKRKWLNHKHVHQNIKCTVCNLQLPKNSRSTHKCKSKEYLCSTCGFKALRKFNLNKHIETHSREPKPKKQHECVHCKQKFQQIGHLKTHLKTHTTLKLSAKHKCEQCNKTFAHNKTLKVHVQQQHEKKKINYKGGFVLWENNELPCKSSDIFSCEQCDYETGRKDNLKRHIKLVHENVKDEKPIKCDKCDYTSPYPSNLKKHMTTVIHSREISRASKYRQLNSLKKELNVRLKKEKDPTKVFGEKEVQQLLEDCKGSIRDILRTIKWMRHCFGRRHFTPNIRQIIQRHIHRLDELHNSEIMTFKDKDKKEVSRVLSKVADVATFVDEIAHIRNIKEPKLILGCDGGQGKVVVTAIIKEQADNDDEYTQDEILKDFKATGQRRVLCLAKVDNIPENRENVEIILNSLELPNLPIDFQMVVDLKLTAIIMGIQSCTSLYACSFCEGCKYDENDKKTNQRGYWRPGPMRTIGNMTLNNDEYVEAGENKKNAKNFKNCIWKPMKLSEGSEDIPIIFKFPPDPLHVNFLGPINDCIEKMESLYTEEMNTFMKKHSISKSGTGPGGQLNGPSIKIILRETSLIELESMLPEEAEHFVSYMRSIRELHRICLAEDLDQDFPSIIQNVQENFDYLFQNFSLNMTLKVHVILHHYSYYFTNTGKTFKDTNGEFVESLHNSLRLHEESHRMKVVRKLGTPGHMKISQASLASFNVKKAGFSPAQSFSLRQKSSPQCLTLSEWCYYY